MTANAWLRWLAGPLAGLSVAVAAATIGADAKATETFTPPRLLSQTGLYSDPATLAIDPRNRAFAPQYPLWTDGAAKRRWVQLPDGRTIDVRDVDNWELPDGTRFWKEFAFGNRRVETRLLVRVKGTQWAFASYVWNAEQTDAERAPIEGLPDVIEIGAGKRHSIPSVEDCRACHDSNRTEALGFTALQLSDDRDPLALHADAAGDTLLTLRDLLRERRLTPERPELVATPPRIPASSPRERAALGYLSANCGACHNTLSSIASLGLVFRQPAYHGGLATVRASLARRTKWDRPGALPETTRVVDPEALDLSALLVRMKSRRPVSQMPPLGSVVPDREAVHLIGGWLRDEVIGDR